MGLIYAYHVIYFHLSDLWVEDEAVYICEAQNHFGKIEAKARITVTGLGRCKCSSTFFSFCTLTSFFIYIGS